MQAVICWVASPSESPSLFSVTLLSPPTQCFLLQSDFSSFVFSYLNPSYSAALFVLSPGSFPLFKKTPPLPQPSPKMEEEVAFPLRCSFSYALPFAPSLALNTFLLSSVVHLVHVLSVMVDPHKVKHSWCSNF